MNDFDAAEETHTTRRKLPHWKQPGCTYFLTFRLHDSIQKSKLDAWNEERNRWLRARNITPESHYQDIIERLNPTQKKEYYATFWKGYHDLLDDCHGTCVLRDLGNAKILEDAFMFFDGERYIMGDFIIMPNHVHLLVTPLDQWDIGELLHSWKRFTARKINERMNKNGQLWQHESYDHIVRNEEQLKRVQRYIKNNPKNLKEGEFLYHAK